MKLEEIEDIIRQADKTLEKTERDFQAAVTMYAASIHGDNIKFLATFTGYGQKRCGEIIRNLRYNKVIKKHEWDVQWGPTELGVIAFILDILVACGYCERSNSNPNIGEHAYKMTNEGMNHVDSMPMLVTDQ